MVKKVFRSAALALAPDLPARWYAGEREAGAELAPIRWKNKALASLAYMSSVKFQLRRLAGGLRPQPGVWPLRALLAEQLKTARRTRQYKRQMAGLGL